MEAFQLLSESNICMKTPAVTLETQKWNLPPAACWERRLFSLSSTRRVMSRIKQTTLSFLFLFLSLWPPAVQTQNSPSWHFIRRDSEASLLFLLRAAKKSDWWPLSPLSNLRSLSLSLSDAQRPKNIRQLVPFFLILHIFFSFLCGANKHKRKLHTLYEHTEKPWRKKM